MIQLLHTPNVIQIPIGTMYHHITTCILIQWVHSTIQREGRMFHIIHFYLEAEEEIKDHQEVVFEITIIHF